MLDACIDIVSAFQRRLKKRGDLAVRIWNADYARNAAPGRIRGDGAESEIACERFRTLRIRCQGLAGLHFGKNGERVRDIVFDAVFNLADIRGKIACFNALRVNLKCTQSKIKALFGDKRNLKRKGFASFRDGNSVERCLHVGGVFKVGIKVVADCFSFLAGRGRLGGNFLDGGHNGTDAARGQGARRSDLTVLIKFIVADLKRFSNTLGQILKRLYAESSRERSGKIFANGIVGRMIILIRRNLLDIEFSVKIERLVLQTGIVVQPVRTVDRIVETLKNRKIYRHCFDSFCVPLPSSLRISNEKVTRKFIFV